MKQRDCTNTPAPTVSRRLNDKRFATASLLAMPLLVGAIAEAGAQEPAPARRAALEEVVVTASRREESLQDVAVSVMALSGNQLAAQGVTDFQDVSNLAAGLYLEKPRNIGDSAVRIRGVGSAPNSGVDPSVGVLVDGVYQIQPGAAFTELLDIERIEVLRGPHGTLFGKNTTAGVIHIHTNDPDPTEFSGRVQGVMGNYDARELRGVLNVPLIDDKLALRLSGFTGSRDGYTRNVFTGQDTRDDDREGGRAKLLWQVTDNFDLLWSSEYLKTAGRVDRGQVEYGRDNITNIAAYRNQPWSVLAAALGQTLPEQSLGRSAENVGEYEDTVERHVLTLNWAFDSHSLQSITAHEIIDSYLLDDRDRTILDLSSLTSNPLRRSWSQEVVLSSAFDGSLSYVVGAFYQTEKLDSPTTIANGPDLVTLGGSSAPATVSTTSRDNATRALFGTVTYDLTSQLSAVVGARYTSDKKETYSTLDIPRVATVVAVDDDETFDEWTYTAKLQYQIDPAKMAYITLDRGFKAGGFNRQNTSCAFGGSCIAADRLIYDSEITDAIEVGLKSEWLDGQIRFNVAAFYQQYDDFQVGQALPGEGSVLITNAGEVESRGAEVELVALLTDYLTVQTSLAYIDSKYDAFQNAPCATPTQPGCVGGSQDLSGERLDNAPEWSGNVGVAYRAPLVGVGGIEWFGRVDVAFKSEHNLDVALSDRTHQGGYALLNARLGLEDTAGNWMVTLWGRNLGDKDYAQTGLLDVAGLMRVQGMPRTYGVTVDWFF